MFPGGGGGANCVLHPGVDNPHYTIGWVRVRVLCKRVGTGGHGWARVGMRVLMQTTLVATPTSGTVLVCAYFWHGPSRRLLLARS